MPIKTEKGKSPHDGGMNLLSRTFTARSRKEKIETKPRIATKPIRRTDLTPGSDYAKVVLPFLRHAAATTIQTAYRQRWHRKADESAQERINRRRTAIRMQTFTEPVDSEAFNQQIKACIQDNHYERINYAHPDFTRHLFAALRCASINMHEMMTAKLMYESLICFNGGKLPTEPCKHFHRFTLNNAEGPYQPAKAIEYWLPHHTNLLAAQLNEPGADENLHYYTINLTRDQMLLYFIYKLGTARYKSPGSRIMHNDPFFNQLQDYINSVKLDPKIKQDALDVLHDFGAEKSVPNNHADKLCKVILDCEQDLFNLVFWKTRPGSTVAENIIDVSTIQFLVNLDEVHCQIPMLCRSPDYDESNPMTPVLSFVLPTIHTLNTLQTIVHGNEATEPVGMIGEQTPKLIRAYDEIAAREINGLSLRDAQLSLLELYPTAKLKSPSRPIELTHPDVPKTATPHGAHCHDFLLSWHDLFHAWRNGSNEKTIIRNLRHIHDEKAGFAVKKNTMPTAVWTLSDLDFSTTNVKRGNPEWSTRVLVFFNLLTKSGFDLDKVSDDNYLLIYHLYRSPNDFVSEGYTPRLIVHAAGASSCGATLNKQAEQIDTTRLKIFSYLDSHPNASIVEVILHDLLHPLKDHDPELLNQLNAIGLKNIFYWSQNTGIYFKKEYRALPGVKARVRENTADALRMALSNIVSTKTASFAIADQVATLPMQPPATHRPSNDELGATTPMPIEQQTTSSTVQMATLLVTGVDPQENDVGSRQDLSAPAPHQSNNIQHDAQTGSTANASTVDVSSDLDQSVVVDDSQLIQTIKQAADNYLAWMKSQEVGIKTDEQGTAQWQVRTTHFFHGASGYNRVSRLLITLDSSILDKEKIEATLKTLDSSRDRKHSFSRYLYNELLGPTVDIHALPDSEFSTMRSRLDAKLNNGIIQNPLRL